MLDTLRALSVSFRDAEWAKIEVIFDAETNSYTVSEQQSETSFVFGYDSMQTCVVKRREKTYMMTDDVVLFIARNMHDENNDTLEMFTDAEREQIKHYLND